MRSKDLIACVFVVGAVALLAAPIWAEGPPTSCTTKSWEIEASFYDVVDCDNPTAGGELLVADPNGNCTGVQYSIEGTKQIAHSAVLVHNPTDPYDQYDEDFPLAGPSESNYINARCEGDPTTSTGIGSCHEQAIRYNPDGDASGPFWFVVAGVREFTTTTVSLKGNKIERCEILGVGDEMTLDEFPSNCVPSCGNFDENQTITRREVLNFKGCWLQFDFDLNTGEVISVQKVDSDRPGDPPKERCDFLDFPVGQLQVTVPGGSAEFATFGDGFISSGTDSCSCRVIGGRVYCWGRPCPR